MLRHHPAAPQNVVQGQVRTPTPDMNPGDPGADKGREDVPLGASLN